MYHRRRSVSVQRPPCIPAPLSFSTSTRLKDREEAVPRITRITRIPFPQPQEPCNAMHRKPNEYRMTRTGCGLPGNETSITSDTVRKRSGLTIDPS
jgi:hypothetical protein